MKVQLPLVPAATKEHVTGFPELGVAVSITSVPISIDDTSKVGVSSEVLLSVSLVPRSDDALRSGVSGPAGLIVMVFADAAERFPTPSTV